MTAIAQALSTALLHFLWQGTLVAFGLAVVLFILRRRSANLRYLASGIALGIAATLPVVTALAAYHPALPGDRIAFDSAFAGAAPAPATTWLAWWQSWALPLWALGVLVSSVRFFAAWSYIVALRRNAEELSEPARLVVSGIFERLGVAASIRILKSSMAEAPSVIGWLRPVILLPSSALSGLTPQQLEAILAHELAHIRRHDYAINVLQMAVETVLFYHPAVWWISGRMRQERELCCDDLVVQACGDPMVYARALTELEKQRQPRITFAVGSSGGPLLVRIQRLMGQPVPVSRGSWVLPAAAILVVVLTLTLSIGAAPGEPLSPSTAGQTAIPPAQALPAQESLAPRQSPEPQAAPAPVVPGQVNPSVAPPAQDPANPGAPVTPEQAPPALPGSPSLPEGGGDIGAEIGEQIRKAILEQVGNIPATFGAVITESVMRSIMLQMESQFERSMQEALANVGNIDPINEEAIRGAIEETNRLVSSESIRRALESAELSSAEMLREAEEQLRRMQEALSSRSTEMNQLREELSRSLDELRSRQEEIRNATEELRRSLEESLEELRRSQPQQQPPQQR